MNDTRSHFLPGTILPLVFVLIGCGQKTYPTTSTTRHIPRAGGVYQIPDELNDDSVVSRAYVSCGTSSECHGGVAMVLIRDTDSSSLCTGFLVASDTLVTNSHCIPAALKSKGASCAKSLYFFFPATNGLAAERADCKEVSDVSVISSEAENSLKPDYAILKLQKPVNRPVFEVSREGFADNSELKVIKVDPWSSGAGGVMTATKCRVIQGTLAIPIFQDDLSPIVSFSDCDARHGNSGSPLLDSSGKVRGILQATLTREQTLLGSLFQALTGEERVMPITMGTNFSCLPVTEWMPSAQPRPDLCENSEVVPYKISAEQKDRISKKNRAQALKAVEDFKVKVDSWSQDENKAAPKGMTWGLAASTFQYDKDEPMMMATPLCLTQDVSWADSLRPRTLLWENGQPVEINMLAPTMSLNAEKNAYTQVITKPKFQKLLFSYKFYLANTKPGQGTVKFESSFFDSQGRLKTETSQLPWCSPAEAQTIGASAH